MVNNTNTHEYISDSGERDFYADESKERNQVFWWKWYIGDDKVIQKIRWSIDAIKYSGYSIKPWLTYGSRKEASTLSYENQKGKNKWDHQGKNLRKWEQVKKIF